VVLAALVAVRGRAALAGGQPGGHGTVQPAAPYDRPASWCSTATSRSRTSRCPRFLVDAAGAARRDPDPFTRLAIEILSRTGMRRSEMLGLTIDAVVQIGSAYWLRVPVGRMHTDRYIPCTRS
jgi:hypothetical protein